MADITIGYKGATIAEISASGTTTLETAGKYCEDDISLQYVRPSAPTQNDDSIYLLRALPYTSYLKQLQKIIGGTVAWNQMVNPTSGQASGTYGNVSVTKNGDGSFTFNGTANARTSYVVVSGFTLIPTHKYYVAGYVKVGSNAGYLGFAGIYIDDGNGKIWQNVSYTSLNLRVDIMIGDVFSNVTMRPVVCDLTLAIGSTIADYIYSLEQGTAGSGVAYFCKLFPKPYYAYNAGELLSVQTNAHRMVGFNQWDEEWEVGNINGSGQPTIDNTTIRSKNFCRCIPNTSYYVRSSKTDGGSQNRYYLKILWYDVDENFISGSWENNRTVTSPAGAALFKIHTNTSTVVYGNTYLHDICINISDASLNGTYQPYCVGNYALDSTIELRGLLKLDANNNLYYDGDEYVPSGTVTRKYEYRAYQSGDESLANAITDGTHTVVKLPTPTTESATPYIEHQACFPNGTEQFVDGRTVEMPVEAVADYEVTS